MADNRRLIVILIGFLFLALLKWYYTEDDREFSFDSDVDFSYPLDTVEVNTVVELENALRNDRVIRITQSLEVSRPIEISGIKRLTIEGSMAETVLKGQTGATTVMEVIQCEYIELKNLRIEQSSGDSFQGVPLSVKNCSKLLISSCSLGGNGVVGLSASNSDSIWVAETRFYNSRSSLVWLSATQEVEFANCLFENSQSRFALELNLGSTVKFFGCRFNDLLLDDALITADTDIEANRQLHSPSQAHFVNCIVKDVDASNLYTFDQQIQRFTFVNTCFQGINFRLPETVTNSCRLNAQ